MAIAQNGSRKALSLAAVVMVAVSTAVAGAGPVSAATPGAATRHGMGLKRTGAVVQPSAGLRELSVLAPAPIALPASVDLTRYAQKVADQGAVNSCATWAIGYGLLGWFANSQGHAGAPFAPMYVYSQVDAGSDAGSSPATVLQLLRTQGIDTAAHYALGHKASTTDWRHQPTAADRAHAAVNKITGWVTLYNTWGAPGSMAVTALKRSLASGRPVALGIGVYNRFMDAYGTGAGSLVTSSGSLGALLGYHEVLALGYNSQGVRIENSWGTEWGDKGYATLDWNYIAQHTFEAETVGGLTSTTGANRPVMTAVSSAGGPSLGGQVVTVTGSKLTNAMVTLGAWTFAPLSITSDGRVLRFQVPMGLPGLAALTVSTPGGISAARTYRYLS